METLPFHLSLTHHVSEHARRAAHFTGSKCCAEHDEKRLSSPGIAPSSLSLALQPNSSFCLFSSPSPIGSVCTLPRSGCWLLPLIGWLFFPPVILSLCPLSLLILPSFRLCEGVHCGHGGELQGAEVDDSERNPLPGLGLSDSS